MNFQSSTLNLLCRKDVRTGTRRESVTFSSIADGGEVWGEEEPGSLLKLNHSPNPFPRLAERGNSFGETRVSTEHAEPSRSRDLICAFLGCSTISVLLNIPRICHPLLHRRC